MQCRTVWMKDPILSSCTWPWIVKKKEKHKQNMTCQSFKPSSFHWQVWNDLLKLTAIHCSQFSEFRETKHALWRRDLWWIYSRHDRRKKNKTTNDSVSSSAPTARFRIAEKTLTDVNVHAHYMAREFLEITNRCKVQYPKPLYHPSFRNSKDHKQFSYAWHRIRKPQHVLVLGRVPRLGTYTQTCTSLTGCNS